MPDLSQLKEMMLATGADRMLVKPLAPNDNSKNQIYLGPGFEALNIIPNEGIYANPSPKNPIFKASLDFGWLLDNGTVVPAPNAQLVFYPQYPEVRFSGFLKGCSQAPSEILRVRDEGRVLFLAVIEDAKIVGYAAAADSPPALEFLSLRDIETEGVFASLPLVPDDSRANARSRLLFELGRIHCLDWIESKALNAEGRLVPCRSTHCVGYTLEAELGISRNGYAEPDYLGWEIKASQVSNFDAASGSKALTLMTPEPTGGYYRDKGVEAFIRKFGYPDKRGRLDRLNFGGIFKAGIHHEGTNLTLELSGFDRESGKITDVSGALRLVTDSGEVASEWSFSALMTLWKRKHSRAVYVPAERRITSILQYRYGSQVRMGVGTDFLRLLNAVSEGTVYYDPGIKLEDESGLKPKVKRRSQFRVKSRDLDQLYESMCVVDV